jgi:succinate dehydrogenase/fumarate reductase flavoprotein subunit
VVLERGETLRGSTGRSIGSIAAAGTPDQRRIGVIDTPEEHARDYRLLSGALAESENDRLVRLLIDNVPDTLAWLRGMGMEFFGPVGEPPHSAPRLHNILPGSTAYIYHLERRARALGIEIRTGVRARELILDEGRVVGVRADIESTDAGRRGDRSEEFYGDRGVILASGDFSASPAMKGELISAAAARYEPVNPYAMGDAQRMVDDVGGRVLNGDLLDAPSIRLSPPPRAGLVGLVQSIPPRRALTIPLRAALRHLPRGLVRTLMSGFVTTYLSPREEMFDDGAVLVDTAGRWTRSQGERVSLTVASLGAAGGVMLGDRRLFERYSDGGEYVATAPGVAHAYMPDFRRSRPDVYREADSVEALAEQMGVSPVVLTRSVAEANLDARAAGRPEMTEAPFFALGPMQSLLLQTNGGVEIDERLRVVGPDGAAIPGLFAAGNAGQGGLALFGHGHHLGWAFTSGRMAARFALAQERAEA